MTSALRKFFRVSARVISVCGLNPGPFTLNGTNTYLIGTGKTRFLLDTGEEDRKDYVQNLDDAMKEYGCSSLQAIFITHFHHDHTGGIPLLRAKFPEVPVYKRLRPGDKKEADLRYFPITDDQQFETEGATLRALYTPGHTTDHVAFHLLEDNAILSGDCILGSGSTTAIRDLSSYMSSLERLLALRPAVIYPGHGDLLTDGERAIQEYISHRQKRESQILENLRGNNRPTSSEEIVQAIYPKLEGRVVIAANRNVLLHLVKLQAEGLVQPESPVRLEGEGCETDFQKEIEETLKLQTVPWRMVAQTEERKEGAILA